MQGKKHISIGILWVLVLAIGNLYGQKEPQYTQYMYNIGSFNPAYVGSVDQTDISLLYRAQWIDIPGAPRTIRAGINVPMSNGKNGLGFNVMNDQLGPTTQTYASVAYSFQIPVSDGAKLSFGLNAGGSILDVDFSKGSFEDENEPLLTSNEINKFYPTLGAGVFLYSDQGYLGISVPNFLTDVINDEEVKPLLTDGVQLNFIGGYVFEVSDGLKFKPAAMAHYLQGLPVKVDVSANFLISDLVTLGASYRFGNAVSGLAGIQISPSVYFGYAYDYNVNGLSGYNSGSHEGILKFYLGNGGGNRNAKERQPRDNGTKTKENKGVPKQIDTPRFF